MKSVILYLSTIRLWYGVMLCAVLPYVLILPWAGGYPGNTYIISMLAIVLANFLSIKSICALVSYPSKNFSLVIISNNILWFILVWVVVRIFELPYSLWYLGLGYTISMVYCFYVFRLYTKRKLILAYIPLGEAEKINHLSGVKWVRLEQPQKSRQKINAYVVDLYSKNLDSDWQKFLAEQTLQGIPVYHVQQIEESLTGRIRIHHMHENNLGSLLPSKNYLVIKHILDCVLVLLSLPVVFPVFLLAALLVKLEDRGRILYSQPRIGYGNRVFTVYKLRSMRENNSESTTAVNDDRITRIGRFIRKTRIDELPQFFNVLKGDMSLIGPRAEFKEFADELEKEIPFYQYRHVVKPGISGWAQVNQGYAVGVEETKIKVEYDFYYIKHFSFSLDVLIFFKTIKTMLTGFGAR